jgi:hypothetical protein
MANTDRARKLLVRSAMATSATIATFVGAQNLAMLDTRMIALTLTPSAESAVVSPAAAMPQTAAPTLLIQKSAPSVIVLRQPQTTNQMVSYQSSAQGNVMAIQPPVPAQMSAPSPVIVQQPVQQSSRSSR